MFQSPCLLGQQNVQEEKVSCSGYSVKSRRLVFRQSNTDTLAHKYEILSTVYFFALVKQQTPCRADDTTKNNP